MQAIHVTEFGPPDVMKVVPLPDPKPSGGQVLVAISAAGVNPVDVYIRSGQYGKLPTLPYTPGSDGAGVVAAIGADVGGLALGQRVWVSGSVTGTYAELALCDAAHVHPVPDWITDSQAAALGVPYLTAYRALVVRGGAKAGESVLVHGATGGTGVAAVQLAGMLGMRVLATGGSPAGRDMLKGMGAAVFDHGAPDYAKAVIESTGGSGVDLIVEMLANKNLDGDLGMLGKGGRVVVIGSRGRVEINPRDLMIREADIRGVLSFNATEADRAEAVAAIQSGLSTKMLAPVVESEFSLDEAPLAHEKVMSAGHCGKVIIRCSAVSGTV